MRRVFAVVAAAAVVGSPAFAKEPCPARPLGALAYPWLIEGVMSGDKYADIYLDINKAGEPTGCRFANTNIRDDNDRFYTCLAFMGQWTAGPKDSAAAPRTVVRKYIAYGSKHQKAEREARKIYLQQHPDVRVECYQEAY
jgi:hypothetical protein